MMETKSKLEKVAKESLSSIEHITELFNGISDLTKGEIKLAKIELKEFFGQIIESLANRMIYQLFKVVLISIGSIFILISLVFALKEYLDLNYSLSLFSVGSLLLIGVIIIPKLSKK